MMCAASFPRLFQSGGLKMKKQQQQQPRRATCHAVSSRRLGKERFDLADSLRRDRENVERSRSLPWHARLKQLQAYPWKHFLAFMVVWSWLGTYVVPYVKGTRPGELPTLGDGRRIPPELRQRAAPMPHFKHLSMRDNECS